MATGFLQLPLQYLLALLAVGRRAVCVTVGAASVVLARVDARLGQLPLTPLAFIGAVASASGMITVRYISMQNALFTNFGGFNSATLCLLKVKMAQYDPKGQQKCCSRCWTPALSLMHLFVHKGAKFPSTFQQRERCCSLFKTKGVEFGDETGWGGWETVPQFLRRQFLILVSLITHWLLTRMRSGRC